MTNFEILNGGGRRRGTRAHVFINCIIKLNNKTGLTMGGGNCIYFKLKVNSSKYVQK